MADESVSAQSQVANEHPMHLDEYIQAHGIRDFGPELVAAYAFVAREAGHLMTNTRTGFRQAIQAFANRPAG